MKKWDQKQLIWFPSMVVVGVAFLGLSSPAAAQAVTWGGIVSGMPSCVSTHVSLSEEVVCVMAGTDQDLYSIQINPRTGTTLGMKTIGYTRSIVGNPSCTASDAPFIACAVRGELNELYGIIFDPVTLANTGLRRLDQSGDYRPLAGDPSCVSTGSTTDHPKLGPPTVNCGVRGTDNRLHLAWFLGKDHPKLGPPSVSCGVRGADNRLHVARFLGQLAGNLAILDRASRAGRRHCRRSQLRAGIGSQIICVARHTDSSLAIIAWSAKNSSSGLLDYQVNSLAGPTPFALGNPSCASTRDAARFSAAGGTVFSSSSLVTCGVRGTDSALYVIRFGINESGIIASTPIEKAFGSDVVAYRSLGGIITNDPSCASTRSQVVTCGVRGTDGRPYLIDVDTETGSSSPYEQQPTLIPGDATCVTFSASERNVACAVLDLKNGLVTIASVRPPL